MGVDIVTGDKLSTRDRAITGICIILPIVNGKAVRAVGTATKGVTKATKSIRKTMATVQVIATISKSEPDFMKLAIRNSDHATSQLAKVISDSHVTKYVDEGVETVGKSGTRKVIEGGLNSVQKTIKDVEAPILPEGSQWERNVLNSFAGGKSNPVTYEGGTVLYRVGGKNGGFWSLDAPPATEYQWRVDTAIKQEFCNDASTLYKMTIPKGASLSGIEGKVGSQGMGLYGDAHQVYIDYRAVPEDWIETSKMIWK